jgi:hypothetical protein
LTTELEIKLVPSTVRVNCGDPARHEVGLIEVTVGTGFAANTLLAAANTKTTAKSFLIDKS